MNQLELFNCVKHFDLFSRAEQKYVLERLAFDFYLRKGYVPNWVRKMQALVATAPLGFKFNPYHDPDNGQFTFGPDDGDDDGGDIPQNYTQLVQEEIPPSIIDEEPAIEAPTGSGPRPSPNFQPPTNPPQMPPTDIPDGWRIREMPPTDQYPNGYWRLEKPMDNGGWQGINPSTMKPGPEPDTHIPFPEQNVG